MANLGNRFVNVSIPLSVTLAGLTACGGGDSSFVPIDAGQPPGYAYVVSAVISGGLDMPGVVTQYAIDASGSLSPTGASVPTGLNPVGMISDPTGHYVYVVSEGDATISQYSVGPGGMLAALSPASVSFGAPFPVGGASSAAGAWISMDPNGHALYVVMTPHDPPGPVSAVAQFSIGSDGTLSPLTSGGISIVGVAGAPLTIDPSGLYGYLATRASTAESTAGAVLQFSIADNGALTQMASATVVAPDVVDVAISPGGQTAYVLSSCVDSACDGQVAEYTVGAGGMLSQTGATTSTSGHVIPISLVIDTAGSSAYLLTNFMGVDTNAGAVYQYAVNGAGELVADTPPSLNVTSGAVAEIVHGPDLYALSSNAVGSAIGAAPGGHIDHYSIGTAGLLTIMGTVSVSEGYPRAMTVVASH